jgi:hypothetical protein
MRTMGASIAALVALAAVVAACRNYMPANRFLQPRQPQSISRATADARRAFDHARHTPVFASAGVTCADCHRFDVLIDTGSADMARELSGRGLFPGSVTCHSCHGPNPTLMAKAPDACTTCHANLAPLVPEDHQIAWLKVHASVSRANADQCATCHRQSFCIDCHERRDTIQTWFHERNFLFYHSIAAQANPMQCGSCHREDFCINCHSALNTGR